MEYQILQIGLEPSRTGLPVSDTSVALVALAITAVANLIIQIIAKRDAASAAKEAHAGIQDAAIAAKQAAAKVEVVKNALAHSADKVLTTEAAKMDLLQKTNTSVDQIHVLVNNRMGVALQSVAIMARRIADLTKSESDEAAAVAADKASAEHDEKQRVVDGINKENK